MNEGMTITKTCMGAAFMGSFGGEYWRCGRRCAEETVDIIEDLSSTIRHRYSVELTAFMKNKINLKLPIHVPFDYCSCTSTTEILR